MPITVHSKPGPLVYTDEQMLAVLCRLAGPDGRLGRRAFERLRHPTDPSASLYERRFGSWGQALELAGLATTPQPDHLRPTATRWTARQLIDAVAEYLDYADSTNSAGSTNPATAAGYDAWRSTQAHHAPPLGTIRYRLGSWSRATELAGITTAAPESGDHP